MYFAFLSNANSLEPQALNRSRRIVQIRLQVVHDEADVAKPLGLRIAIVNLHIQTDRVPVAKASQLKTCLEIGVLLGAVIPSEFEALVPLCS